MKAWEIFQSITPALGSEIIDFLREHHKDVYRAAINALATRRNLRLQFVQKKSRVQQTAWLLESLRLRTSEAIGEQVLQVWLMRAQSPLLVAFLDALEIAHDGKGATENLPQALDAERLPAAIASALEKFPAETVAVYLHVFQLQQPGGWPELATAMESEPRLRLGSGEIRSA